MEVFKKRVNIRWIRPHLSLLFCFVTFFLGSKKVNFVSSTLQLDQAMYATYFFFFFLAHFYFPAFGHTSCGRVVLPFPPPGYCLHFFFA